MSNGSEFSEGNCTCGQLRYRVRGTPLIVHCCHCRGCQRNSGSAFALNALFETGAVEHLSGKLENVTVPTPSGRGQGIARCATCKVAVWSHYNMGGLREYIRFVRVGTLVQPDQFRPDVHIFTESKQPWVVIPPNDRAFGRFYDFGKTWSKNSLKRLAKIESEAGIVIS